jgi:EpsI family protein
MWVDVLVVQQYAFVALLILATWALVGTQVARYLAFPLGFLLLAVPAGAEGLIQPMMDFTADFTVGMLRFTGIPVYRDGTFFSIPSGDWSVVEACSGIRYLLAAITLGVLYAYLTYSKLWKRLLFILASILMAIIANGLRAYMIVMIGHLSDMRFATGTDHLIYGWAFFGIIVAVMFAIGAIWRDPPVDDAPLARQSGRHQGLLTVALAAVAAGALWVGVSWASERQIGADSPVALNAPQASGTWSAEGDSLWSWRPDVMGPDGDLFSFYRSAKGPVSLYLGVYRSQGKDSELVSSANQMAAPSDPQWSDKEITSRRIELATGAITVSQSRLASRSGERLLVWNWYRIGGRQTSNRYVAKFLEAGQRLFGGRRDGALIAVATPTGETEGDAPEILEAFISAMLPAIEAEIDRSLAAPNP